jgi:hypothetical protein
VMRPSKVMAKALSADGARRMCPEVLSESAQLRAG